MAYRVIKDFADAQDRGYIYRAGDIYPRAGKASESRVAELSGRINRLGQPLIIFQAEDDQQMTNTTPSAEKPKRGRPKSTK